MLARMTDVAPPRPAARAPMFDSGFVAVARNGRNQGLLRLVIYNDDTAELFHRLRTRSIAKLTQLGIDPPLPWADGTTVRLVGITAAGQAEEWSVLVDRTTRKSRSGCSSCGQR